jgi:hypothetical protein
MVTMTTIGPNGIKLIVSHDKNLKFYLYHKINMFITLSVFTVIDTATDRMYFLGSMNRLVTYSGFSS